ncbi:MAG: hypothetical protein LRS43_01835 [Desulfurococcales archaeon]|nr:hypothetical protein [Desulfurococcales archaeon]
MDPRLEAVARLLLVALLLAHVQGQPTSGDSGAGLAVLLGESRLVFTGFSSCGLVVAALAGYEDKTTISLVDPLDASIAWHLTLAGIPEGLLVDVDTIYLALFDGNDSLELAVIGCDGSVRGFYEVLHGLSRAKPVVGMGLLDKWILVAVSNSVERRVSVILLSGEGGRLEPEGSYTIKLQLPDGVYGVIKLGVSTDGSRAYVYGIYLNEPRPYQIAGSFIVALQPGSEGLSIAESYYAERVVIRGLDAYKGEIVVAGSYLTYEGARAYSRDPLVLWRVDGEWGGFLLDPDRVLSGACVASRDGGFYVGVPPYYLAVARGGQAEWLQVSVKVGGREFILLDCKAGEYGVILTAVNPGPGPRPMIVLQASSLSQGVYSSRGLQVEVSVSTLPGSEMPLEPLPGDLVKRPSGGLIKITLSPHNATIAMTTPEEALAPGGGAPGVEFYAGELAREAGYETPPGEPPTTTGAADVGEPLNATATGEEVGGDGGRLVLAAALAAVATLSLLLAYMRRRRAPS